MNKKILISYAFLSITGMQNSLFAFPEGHIDGKNLAELPGNLAGEPGRAQPGSPSEGAIAATSAAHESLNMPLLDLNDTYARLAQEGNHNPTQEEVAAKYRELQQKVTPTQNRNGITVSKDPAAVPNPTVERTATPESRGLERLPGESFYDYQDRLAAQQFGDELTASLSGTAPKISSFKRTLNKVSESFQALKRKLAGLKISKPKRAQLEKQSANLESDINAANKTKSITPKIKALASRIAKGLSDFYEALTAPTIYDFFGDLNPTGEYLDTGWQ